MKFLPLLGLVVALPARDTAGGYACPAVAVPAVAVRVLDGATGEPAVDGAVGVARDGAFADTLGAGLYGADGGDAVAALVGVYGRPGTYRVTVDRAGYERWTQAGVTVRSSGGACPQPVTAVLEARLVREGDGGAAAR